MLEEPVKRPEGHRWHIFTQLVRATYGDICVVCGHGGAHQVDHLESVTEKPGLAWDLANCRPIHGSPRNPCPLCTELAGTKIYCNQIKTMGSIQRAQRIIQEKIEANSGGKTPEKRRPAVRPAADPGREW